MFTLSRVPHRLSAPRGVVRYAVASHMKHTLHIDTARPIDAAVGLSLSPVAALAAAAPLPAAAVVATTPLPSRTMPSAWEEESAWQSRMEGERIRSLGAANVREVP